MLCGVACAILSIFSRFRKQGKSGPCCWSSGEVCCRGKGTSTLTPGSGGGSPWMMSACLDRWVERWKRGLDVGLPT